MAVVDGRDPELGRCQPRAGQEPLDFRQKGLAGADHSRINGELPISQWVLPKTNPQRFARAPYNMGFLTCGINIAA